MIQRQWNVVFYKQDGTTFLKTVSSERPDTGNLGYLYAPPIFRSAINGGFGECVLNLVGPEYRFDDFEEGSTISFMNLVEIYAVNELHPLGIRIYKGFISKYQPYLKNDGSEGVQVTLLGLVSLLSMTHFATGGAFTVSYTSTDPAQMVKDIIDNVPFGGSLFSYAGTVETVGSLVSYDFVDRKMLDAMNDTLALVGSNWWWFIDQFGQVYFQPQPSVATHTFTIGKDVNAVTVIKDSEKVVNRVEVRGNGETYDQDDTPSQATYGTGSPANGVRSEIVTDSNIASHGGVINRAAWELANYKDALVGGTIEINTNYDIESIKVGETCNVVNVKNGSSVFADNMPIVSIDYNGDTVTLQLAQDTIHFGHTLKTFFGKSPGIFIYG